MEGQRDPTELVAACRRVVEGLALVGDVAEDGREDGRHDQHDHEGRRQLLPQHPPHALAVALGEFVRAVLQQAGIRLAARQPVGG